MADKYDLLKLENRICFPLYACAKEVVKTYKPSLEELDLTYTQYITMMVMWEQKERRVKDVGKRSLFRSDSVRVSRWIRRKRRYCMTCFMN